MKYILTGLFLGTFFVSYILAFGASAAISYKVFMGDDPFDGKFKGAGTAYFAGAFLLVFVFGGLVTAFWDWTGAFST